MRFIANDIIYMWSVKYQLHEYEREIMILSAKIRFLKDVMDDRLILYKRKRIQIIDDLRKHNYPQYKDKVR